MPDTFDEVGGEQVLVKDGSKGSYVHIRIQQRNGRKSLTTVQGLAIDLDLKKILKALKKTYSTNGTILVDDEVGEVIQLQGQTNNKRQTQSQSERASGVAATAGWCHHSGARAARLASAVAALLATCAAFALPLSRSTFPHCLRSYVLLSLFRSLYLSRARRRPAQERLRIFDQVQHSRQERGQGARFLIDFYDTPLSLPLCNLQLILLFGLAPCQSARNNRRSSVLRRPHPHCLIVDSRPSPLSSVDCADFPSFHTR